MEQDNEWLIAGATKDAKSITSDWELRVVNQPLISGLRVQEIRNVPTGYGHLTEIFRTDWKLDGLGVEQVFQSVFDPGAVSAWHAHAVTTDRLFVAQGRMLIALYDSRPGSPTCGLLNRFYFGPIRPAILVVPPQIWHGVKNVSSVPGTLINVVDRAYDYDEPDHYRLPTHTDKIPYRFQSAQQSSVCDALSAMEILETALNGVLLLKPRVFVDRRGFFLESYRMDICERLAISPFVQENHSRSRRGVIRGIHYQLKHAQAKLVRVPHGVIFDVAVDLRRGSPTFGRWYSAVLSDDNQRQLCLPRGVAHAFCVLSESADVTIRLTDYYHPEDDYGVIWNDPDLDIQWPVSPPVLSDRDTRWRRLRDVPPEHLPVANG